MATRLIGARIPRNEDARLLRGRGCYVDDIQPAGVLHAACLRSPHAHARIIRIDAGIAAGRPAPANLDPLRRAPQALPPHVPRPIDCLDMMVDAQSGYARALGRARHRLCWLRSPVAYIFKYIFLGEGEAAPVTPPCAQSDRPTLTLTGPGGDAARAPGPLEREVGPRSTRHLVVPPLAAIAALQLLLGPSSAALRRSFAAG